METIRASRLARSRFKADPYPFYARMRREAPVFRIAAPFGIRAWLATRYDDVASVLKDERFSKDVSGKATWLPPFARPVVQHMLNKDPPDHTRLRALVSQAFTPRRIEALRSRIQEICEQLLSARARDASFDLVQAYALPLPLTVIADLLGIDAADRGRFHALTRGSLAIGAPTSILDVPLALPYVFLMSRYFRKLFAERRARPREDLLTALVQAEEAGDRLSEDELLGTAILLLVAGYETTVHLVASGALALLEHPAERLRFVEEPGLAARAVDELLRYTSPVEITPPRVTKQDVALGSVVIPAGEFVAGVLGSANRDEAQFPDPERLDLGRDPNRHLALGLGSHFCLGASLARMEAEVALTTLFRRLPGLHLARHKEDLRWRRTLPLRALVELPVRG
jgi:cytochrome P450 PksS